MYVTHYGYIIVFVIPELAEYLLLLDSNDEMYNSYFKWKGHLSNIDTKFYCRLCALLHDDVHGESSYPDIDAWWNGPDVCRRVSPGNPYASWKHKNLDNNIDTSAKVSLPFHFI